MDASPLDDPISALEAHCKTIALEFMKMHPAVGRIEDENLKNTCLEALHAMTTELEVIKKHLIKSRRQDDDSVDI